MSDWDDFGCFGPAKPITCRYCGHEFYPKPPPGGTGYSDYHCPKCGREHKFDWEQRITVMTAELKFNENCAKCHKPFSACQCPQNAESKENHPTVTTTSTQHLFSNPPTPVLTENDRLIGSPLLNPVEIRPTTTTTQQSIRPFLLNTSPVLGPGENDGDRDSEIGDYVADHHTFEYNLVTTDVLNEMEDMEHYLHVYDLLMAVRRRRRRTLRHRNRGPNAFGFTEERLKSIYEKDAILLQIQTWFSCLQQLFIYKLEHINDALWCNLLFNEKYGTRLLLHEVEHTRNFRARITNFLSRVRNRHYNVERIYSWTRQLLSSYRVLSSGLLAPENVDPITIDL